MRLALVFGFLILVPSLAAVPVTFVNSHNLDRYQWNVFPPGGGMNLSNLQLRPAQSLTVNFDPGTYTVQTVRWTTETASTVLATASYTFKPVEEYQFVILSSGTRAYAVTSAKLRTEALALVWIVLGVGFFMGYYVLSPLETA